MSKLYLGEISPQNKKVLTDIVEALIKKALQTKNTRQAAQQCVNLFTTRATFLQSVKA